MHEYTCVLQLLKDKAGEAGGTAGHMANTPRQPTARHRDQHPYTAAAP